MNLKLSYLSKSSMLPQFYIKMIILIPMDGISHFKQQSEYIDRQVSNIRRTLVGNKIVDNSDVGGASPVGAAPTTSSIST